LHRRGDRNERAQARATTLNRFWQYVAIAGCLSLAAPARAQQPATSLPPDERLKVDILVVSPHPDDESYIAGYLAKAVLDEHRRVAVLFTTRGDAGSNLVGYEQGRSLGEIREWETRHALASIGITNVWFLRMPDTPGGDVNDVLRSLGSANHGNALGETVRFIRMTRPDVVIAMLPAIAVGENHEDHQASAVIATEAFDLAGDPTWFPEQIGEPEDRLYYGNLIEGLHPWQAKKLYYYTDATHFDFMQGKGPVYSMTATSPSQHVSYARLAAQELSYHRTQYGDDPARALATNQLADFEVPLPFVLAKSLAGGSVTGDIMEGVTSGRIPFAPVHGYREPEHAPDYSVELGGAWQFYARFYPAHNLDVMTTLLAPELGVGGGQAFPVPLVLHNNTDRAATFRLRTQLPPGWSVDSASTLHGHPWPTTTFTVAPHDDFALRIRLVAARPDTSQWQTITWVADVDGRATDPVKLRIHVGGH
jgi:LmbE family N-acetylglucosaminyl deacetylase